ncbi:SepF-like predicted cell division protein (DUF552 family) [Sphingomonas sp. UYAg733]
MRSKLVLRVFALLACQLSAGAVSAQERAPASDTSSEDIVVTAAKELDAKAATHFVREISATTQGQLAKFLAPICPVAIGFEPAAAAIIVARIRDVAKRVGAEVAKPGCSGNVILLTTPDGQALVRELRKKHPQLLEGLTPNEINRLIDRPGPVRVWSRTAIANEDGKRASGGPGETTGEFRVLEVKSASAFHPQSQQVIDTATVVIDSAAVLGKSLTQLADYSAMRALARTRPIEGRTIDTILGLFGDSSAATAPGMTAADLTYLKALYAMPGNRSTTYQVGHIAKQVRKGTPLPQD